MSYLELINKTYYNSFTVSLECYDLSNCSVPANY